MTRRVPLFAPPAAVAGVVAVSFYGLRGVVPSSALPLALTSVVFAALIVASILFDRGRIRRTRDIAAKLRARDLDAVTALTPPSLDPIHIELLDISAELRRREIELAEGKTLLFAALEMTPAAILLLSSRGEILASNGEARRLFFDDQDLTRCSMFELLARGRPLFRRVLAASADELFTTEGIEQESGPPTTHHLSKRYFELGGDDVVLVMLTDVTREASRREVDVYKRVIRILSHEVNNSLAPISSLMHSARLLVKKGVEEGRLARVFDAVSERATHLQRFLDGYGRLARLPLPRKEQVAWAPFLDRLRELFPEVLVDESPGQLDEGWFDRGQIEQALVNLVKNAQEAKSEPRDISIAVTSSPESGTTLTVRDRGVGMSSDVMKNALVPLFSTKDHGSGVGLSICREIVDAHGGTLRLGARAGGGLEVVIRLPPRVKSNTRSRSWAPSQDGRGMAAS